MAKIISAIMTNNPCYTCGRKLANGVKGLMLHSVGCPQPSAQVFVKNWNKASYDRACVHAFIDGNTGDVYQTLPWDRRGWHCASGKNGSGNNTHIGVEMCEPACIKYTGGATFTCSDLTTARAVAQRTYQAAVELFAMLCKQYNLDPMKDGVILSHKEGHAHGIASNHGDPEHLWNQLGTGYTMNTFRKAVWDALQAASGTGSSNPTPSAKPATEALYRVQVGAYKRKSNADAMLAKIKAAGFDGFVKLDGELYKVQVGAYKDSVKAKNSCETVKKAGFPAMLVKSLTGPQEGPQEGFKPYRVQVHTPVLNVRQEASTGAVRVGSVRQGEVLTIVEESTGQGATLWGKVENKNGWISLDFVKKV